MAHYAILDKNNNTVVNVVVVDTESTIDENGIEREELGVEICRKVLNDPDIRAVRTSYNNNIRVRYAGIGYTYDENLDVFIPPQPFPSWTLNTSTADWEPPVPKPSNQSEDGFYRWDEDSLNWIFVEVPKPPQPEQQ